jgi:hypothetical protein
MLTHAPEALRLRTTRSWWPWRLPRVTLEMALYVAVCTLSLGAAALVVFLLLNDDRTAWEGPLAQGLAVGAERR